MTSRISGYQVVFNGHELRQVSDSLNYREANAPQAYGAYTLNPDYPNKFQATDTANGTIVKWENGLSVRHNGVPTNERRVLVKQGDTFVAEGVEVNGEKAYLRVEFEPSPARAEVR